MSNFSDYIDEMRAREFIYEAIQLLEQLAKKSKMKALKPWSTKMTWLRRQAEWWKP